MKYAFLIGVAILGLSAISYIGGWFGEAADVAQKELGPKAALEKYEWFKNQAAAIRTAELARDQFKGQLQALEASQAKLTDTVSIQLAEGRISQSRADLTAFEANLKNLKEEYNAASSKANWSLFKDSDVPQRY